MLRVTDANHRIILKLAVVKRISKRALSLRNGQDMDEIWIAYNGKVYDVTESRLWHHGKHYEHWAGQDLTEELTDAPHTDTVFERFPLIGTLQS
jgi:predicted heme/steroid binding protein